MLEALGLMLIMPVWFATAFAVMFVSPSFEWLLLIPFTGMSSLLIGAGLGVKKKAKGLFLFSASALASLALAFVAGMLRGKFESDAIQPVLIAFLIFQGLLLAFLVYRNRLVWLTALVFAYGWFSVAFFSAFVAAMALSDTWI